MTKDTSWDWSQLTVTAISLVPAALILSSGRYDPAVEYLKYGAVNFVLMYVTPAVALLFLAVRIQRLLIRKFHETNFAKFLGVLAISLFQISIAYTWSHKLAIQDELVTIEACLNRIADQSQSEKCGAIIDSNPLFISANTESKIRMRLKEWDSRGIAELIRKGIAAFERRDYAAANAIANEILKLDPNNTDALELQRYSTQPVKPKMHHSASSGP
jgi:hypothetical protein